MLGMTESRASKEAGLSDSAIRNVRRGLKDGKDPKFASRTLEALAPVLETSVSWLMEGGDDPKVDPTLSKIIRLWGGLTRDQKEAILVLVKPSPSEAQPVGQEQSPADRRSS